MVCNWSRYPWNFFNARTTTTTLLSSPFTSLLFPFSVPSKNGVSRPSWLMFDYVLSPVLKFVSRCERERKIDRLWMHSASIWSHAPCAVVFDFKLAVQHGQRLMTRDLGSQVYTNSDGVSVSTRRIGPGVCVDNLWQQSSVHDLSSLPGSMSASPADT